MANPKVLIVEDDRLTAHIEHRRLSKPGDAVCGSAGTGTEALDGVTTMRPDNIFLGISLEGKVDGREIARQIKKGFHTSGNFCPGSNRWGNHGTCEGNLCRRNYPKTV